MVSQRDKSRGHATVAVIGHVDSGKSTTTGHLIYKCGGIDKRTMDKFTKDSAEKNRESFRYAWILDRTNSERERGITIDCSLNELILKHMIITICDAPGHRDFLKNMITGTANAEFAVVVVPAGKGEFETAIGESGVLRQQCKLSFTTGIRQVCYFINKMDMANYEEARFNEITEFCQAMMRKIGFNPECIAYMPGSGLVGDNLVEVSEKMPWYKGWKYQYILPDKTSKLIKGETLYDWFDSLVEPPRDNTKDLRGTISDSYKVGGVGVVAVGRIQAGTLKPMDTIYISPVDILTEVKTIEMHHQSLEMAEAGDNIGINIKNVAVKDVRRGCVFGLSSRNPPREALLFTAHIMAIEKIGADSGIRVNYCPVLDVHSAHLPVKVTKIISVTSKKAAKVAVEDGVPLVIRKDESGVCEMQPQKPLSVEEFANYPSLGRFSMRDSNQTVAVGVIKKVEFKEASAKKGAAPGVAKAKAGAKKKTKA